MQTLINTLDSVKNFKKKFPLIYEAEKLDYMYVHEITLKGIKELKSVYVRKQSYEEAASLRNIERDLIDLLNNNLIIHVDFTKTEDVIKFQKLHNNNYKTIDEVLNSYLKKGIEHIFYQYGTNTIILQLTYDNCFEVNADKIKNISLL